MAPVLILHPQELVFRDVQLGESLTLTNTLKGPAEAEIRAGSSDRYTVSPASIRLRPGESATVDVRLKVVRFANRQKAVEQGQKDAFHIKGNFFDQKFYATFFLAPDDGGEAKRAAKGKTSPRDISPGDGRPAKDREPAGIGAPGMAAVGSRQQGSPPARLRPAAAAALPSSAALLTGVRAGLSNILAPMRSPMRGPDPHAAGSGASSPTLAPGSPTSSSSTRGARGHPGGTAWHIAASHTTMTVRPQPSPGRARPVSSSFDFGKPGASTVLQRTPHLSGPTGAGGKPPLARAAAHGLGRGALGDAGTSATTAPRSAPSSPLRGSVAALPTAPGRVVAEPLPHTRYAAPSATRATPAGTDGGTIRMPRNLWEDVPVSSTLGSSRGAGSALQDVGGASSTGPPTLRAWEAGQDQEGHSDSVAEEERAVGLHRVRSSIQRLEVATQEAAARSRSPSPSSSRASPSLAGSAVAGEALGRVWVQEAEARSRSRSRSHSPTSSPQPAASPPPRVDSPSVALQSALQQLRPLSPRSKDPTGAGSSLQAGPAGAAYKASQPRSSPSRGSQIAASTAALRSALLAAQSTAQPSSAATAPPQPTAPAQAARRPVSQRSVAAQQPADSPIPAAAPGQTAQARQHPPAMQPPTQPPSSKQQARPDPPPRPAAETSPGAAPGASGAEQGRVTHLLSQLRESREQVALLQARCSSQLQALGDKEGALHAAERQMAALQEANAALRRGSGTSAGTGSAGAPEGQPSRDDLLATNRQLSTRVQDLEASVQRYREESTALRRMQLELQARAPDTKRLVEAAIAREQALQEERNRKALELLVAKDQQIEELQAKAREVEALVSEMVGYRTREQALLDRAAQAEASVMEALLSKDALREEIEVERGEYGKRMSELLAELAEATTVGSGMSVMQERVQQAHKELQAAHAMLEAKAADLAAARGEASELLSRLSLATERIKHLEDLRSRADAQHAERSRALTSHHEARVSELEQRLAQQQEQLETQRQQLESIYAGGGGGRLPKLGLGAGPSGMQSLENAGLRRRLLSAEGLIKQLESSLAAATGRASGPATAPGSSDPGIQGSAADGSHSAAGNGVQAAGSEAPAPDFAEGTAVMTNSQQFELDHLRQVLAERESELATLRAQAAVLDTSRELGAGDQVRELSSALARNELAAHMAEERVAMLESQLAVAQERAALGADVSRSAGDAQLEARRAAADAEAARATAARLNARVTDLAASEAAAKAAAESARKELQQARDQHAKELQTLEERYRRLMGPGVQLTVVAPSTGSEAHDERVGASHGRLLQGQAPVAQAVSKAREEQLQKAVNDAEAALAVVQAKLLEAMKGQVALQGEMMAVKREAEHTRLKLEAEVRQAREEGSLRIRTLEDALQRLSAARSSGEAGVEVARLVSDTDAARRAESRARADVAHLQDLLALEEQRHRHLADELAVKDQQLAELWVYSAFGPAAAPAFAPAPAPELGPRVGPGQQAATSPRGAQHAPGNAAATFSPRPGPGLDPGPQDLTQALLLDASLEKRLRIQYEELTKRQQMIARLAEEVDSARQEAQAAQAELGRFKAAMPDPKEPAQAQITQLARKLAACEAELSAARAARDSALLEAEHKACALSESQREVQALQGSLQSAEKRAAAAENDAARRAAQVHGSLSAEVVALTRRAEEAELKLTQAHNELESLRSELDATRQQASEAASALSAAAAELENERKARKACEQEARRGAAAAGKDLEAAELEADQRRAQVAVLMETVEALQAKAAGDSEARMLTLTVQLAAAKAREVALERRCQELLEECQRRQDRTSAATSELESATARLRSQDQQLGALAGTREGLEAQLRQARADAKKQADATLDAAREVDALRARLTVAEADSEGLRASLRDIQARHVEQLAREREEAADALRQARLEAASRHPPAEGDTSFVSRVEGPLQDLLSVVTRRVSAMEDPAAVQWAVDIMLKLKIIALDAEQLYMKASADARISQQAARTAAGHAISDRAALEARTAEWQAAQVALQRLQRVVGRKTEQASSHASHMVIDLQRRLDQVSMLLDVSAARAVTATAEATSATASLAKEQARADMLQRQLDTCTAEVEELSARHAAAQMELEACLSVQGPMPLSTELSQYMEAQVGRLALRSDARDQVTMLMCELAAMRQATTQLQASLAAAEKRCAASQLLVQSLRSTARAAEARLAQLQQLPTYAQPLTSTSGASTSGPQQGGQQAAAPSAGASAQGDRSGALPQGPRPMTVFSSAAPSPAHDLAKVTAQLAVALREAREASGQVAAVTLELKQRELDVQELQAQAAAHDLLLQQIRDEGAAGLLAQRTQLDQAHDADRALLLREIGELQSRVAALRQLAARDAEEAEQRLAAVRETVGTELDAAVSRAVEGRVDVEVVHEAEARAARAEREASRLAREIDNLTEQLVKAQAQVAELTDVKDVTAAAVEGLEATLSRLEAAAEAGLLGGGSSGPDRPGGTAAGANGRRRRVDARSSLRASADGLQSAVAAASGGAAASTIDGLAREVVRAKLSEAEAVRKLRAAARTEVELRQKLLQREARINELKTAASGNGSQPSQLYRDGYGGPGTAAVPGGSRARSVSPSRPWRGAGVMGCHHHGHGADAAAAVARGGTAHKAAGRQRHAVSAPRGRPGSTTTPTRSREGGPHASAAAAAHEGASAAQLQAQVLAWEADYQALSQQLTGLRLELVKRDAEVQRLETELAAAVARQRQPVSPRATAGPTNPAVERTKAQLAAANAQLVSTYTGVMSILRKLEGTPQQTSSRHATAAAARRVGPHDAPPDVAHIPALLADGLARLERLVASSQAATDIHRGGSLPAPTPAVGSTGSASMLAALQLEGAERRAGQMREAYHAAAAERDRLAAQVKDLQASVTRSASTSAAAPNIVGSTSDATRLGRSTSAGADAGSSHHQSQPPMQAQAQHLVGLLRSSINSLHGACAQLEASCSSPAPSASELKRCSGQVVSEVLGLEATLGLLVAQLGSRRQEGSSAGESVPGPRGGSQGGGGHSAVMDEEEGQQGSETGSFAFQTNMAARQGSSSGAGVSLMHGAARGLPVLHTPVEAIGGVSEGPPSPDSTTSSSVPSLSDVLRPAPISGFGAAPSVLDPNPTASALLAEQLLQQRAATEKWKRRARQLGQQLALAGAGAAARDAAVTERMVTAERGLEEQVVRYKAEAHRLQAALAGSEAARRELEAAAAAAGSASAAASQAASAAARAAADAAAAALGGKHSNHIARPAAGQNGASGTAAGASQPPVTGDLDMLLTSSAQAGGLAGSALSARLAELQARCAVLERQLDTERAQASAANTAHTDEVSRLRGLLAQEQGERARLLGGMRDALAGLKATGDTEGKLRGELLQAHQAAAAAQSAHDRAEAQASTWKAESRALREKLQASEKARVEAVQSMEARLVAAERRLERMSQASSAKTDELLSRLGTMGAALTAPLASDTQLRHLEEDMQALSQSVQALQAAAAQEAASEKWQVLAHVARYQAAVAAATREAQTLREAATREQAEHQVALSDAQRRCEALGEELRLARDRAAESARAADAERAQMADRHLAHINELQARIAQERQAMAAEAAARSEALALARAGEASAAAAMQTAALEARYTAALAGAQAVSDGLRAELEQARSAFRAFQQQKAQEISELEDRIVQLIGQGGGKAAAVAAGWSQLLSAPHYMEPLGRGSGRVPVNKRPNTTAGAVVAARQGVKQSGGVSGGQGTHRGGRLAANRRGKAAGAGVAGAVHSKPLPTSIWEEEGDDVWGGAGDQAAGGLPAGPKPALHAPQGAAVPAVLEVAEAAAGDTAAAARREALFERLQRQRAEALLAGARKVVSALKTRARLTQRQLDTLRATTVSGEEHAHVLTEVSNLRDALKAAKTESSRRQKALQMLQALAQHNLLQPGSQLAPSSSSGAVLGQGQSQDDGTEPLAAQAASSAAVAAAAAASAAAASAEQVMQALSPEPGPSPGFRHALTELEQLAGGSAAYMTVPGGPPGGIAAAPGNEDPFAQAAATAAAAAASAGAALSAERAAREASEAKLRGARLALERKTAHAKDLRKRVEELEGHVALLQGEGMAAALAAAEAQARTAQASVARKDSLIKALKERVDALTAERDAAGQRNDGGTEEVNRLQRASGRLKQELLRKEAALGAAMAELDKVRSQVSSATSSAEDALKREARSARTASTEVAALTARAAELLGAVKQLLYLLGRCIAVMTAAAAASNAAGSSLAAVQQGSQAPATSGSAEPEAKGAVTAAAAAGLSAGDIAALTGLSLPEVQHLLGTGSEPVAGSSAGAAASTRTALDSQLKPSPDAVASARARVDGLLSVLEATLLPAAAQQATAGLQRSLQQGPTRNQELKQRLLAWDPSNAGLLVQHMEAEVAAAESELIST